MIDFKAKLEQFNTQNEALKKRRANAKKNKKTAEKPANKSPFAGLSDAEIGQRRKAYSEKLAESGFNRNPVAQIKDIMNQQAKKTVNEVVNPVVAGVPDYNNIPRQIPVRQKQYDDAVNKAYNEMKQFNPEYINTQKNELVKNLYPQKKVMDNILNNTPNYNYATFGAGNINLNSLPTYKLNDRFTTGQHYIFNNNGKYILIPGVRETKYVPEKTFYPANLNEYMTGYKNKPQNVQGNQLTYNEAVELYKKSGKHFGIFDSEKDATAYAVRLNERLNKEYEPRFGTHKGGIGKGTKRLLNAVAEGAFLHSQPDVILSSSEFGVNLFSGGMLSKAYSELELKYPNMKDRNKFFEDRDRGRLPESYKKLPWILQKSLEYKLGKNQFINQSRQTTQTGNYFFDNLVTNGVESAAEMWALSMGTSVGSTAVNSLEAEKAMKKAYDLYKSSAAKRLGASVVTFLMPDSSVTNLMGLYASSEKYNELISKNVPAGTATINALATGYISALSEKMGYSELHFFENLDNNFTNNFIKNFGRAATKYIVNSSSEGYEEIANRQLELLVDWTTYDDSIALADLTDFSANSEVFWGGAVAGAMMGGIGLVRTVVDAKHTANKINEKINVLNFVNKNLPSDFQVKPLNAKNASVEDINLYAAKIISAHESILMNNLRFTADTVGGKIYSDNNIPQFTPSVNSENKAKSETDNIIKRIMSGERVQNTELFKIAFNAENRTRFKEITGEALPEKPAEARWKLNEYVNHYAFDKTIESILAGNAVTEQDIDNMVKNKSELTGYDLSGTDEEAHQKARKYLEEYHKTVSEAMEKVGAAKRQAEQRVREADEALYIHEHTLTPDKVDKTDLRNKKVIKGLAEKFNLVYDPNAESGAFIPAKAKGENPTLIIRDDNDVAHEVSHAIRKAVSDGKISGKEFERLKSRLFNSSFFTDHILLNEDFKLSLFDEDTASRIGTKEEFIEALGEKYREEYSKLEGKDFDNAVEEEAFAFAMQEIANTDDTTFVRLFRENRPLFERIKQFFADLIARFKGAESSEIREAAFIRSVVDRFNEMYKKAVEGEASAEISDNGVRYNKSPKYTFAKQVHDALLGNNKNLPSGFSVYVGETCNLLQKVGLEPRALLMNQSHLRDINHEKSPKNRHWHGLSEPIIVQLPNLLKSPVAIYDSISKENKENSICVLTNKFDGENPIIVSIKQSDGDEKYYNVEMDVIKVENSNYATSMYGRESFLCHLEKILDNDAMLYVSKAPIEKLLKEISRRTNADIKLELLDRLDALGFDKIIHQSRNLVNSNSMQNSKNNSQKSDSGERKNLQNRGLSEEIRKERASSKRELYSSFDIPLHNRGELNSIMQAVYDTVEKGRSVSDRVKSMLYDMLIENSESVNDEWAEENREFIDYFKNITLKIDEGVMHEIGNGKWNDVLKAAGGKFGVSKNSGADISVAYREASELFPGLLDPDINNASDQLQELISVLDTMKSEKTDVVTANKGFMSEDDFRKMLNDNLEQHRLNTDIHKLRSGKELTKNEITWLTENHKEEVEKAIGKSFDSMEELKEYLTTPRIVQGMSDEERYELLKRKKITVGVANDAYKNNLKNNEINSLKSKFKKEAKTILKKVADEFNVFKSYKNSDIDLEFVFSKTSLTESVNKQNKQYEAFAKMLSVFDYVTNNAIGIEAHGDKYIGTKRESNNLKGVYVLLSAFKTENKIYPVKMEVKEFKKNENNKLHVAICLNEIEDTFSGQAMQSNAHHNPPASSDIMLADLISNVKPSDGEMLKYIPDGFLNNEQKEAKKEAIRKDNERLEWMRNNPGNRSKDSFAEKDNNQNERLSDEKVHGIYEELVKKNGSIKPGEKRERDVSIPQKDSNKRPVSYFARTLGESKVALQDSEFERLIVDGRMSREVISDKKAERYADEVINTDGYEYSVGYFIRSVRDGNTDKKLIALGQQLYNQAVTSKDVSTATELAANLSVLASRAGQSLQAQRMLKKMTPDGRLYYMEKTIEQLNRELEERHKEKGEAPPKISIKKELALNLLNSETAEEMDNAIDAIYEDCGKQMPSGAMDKWNEWRYIAMLANPKTHIRNLIGNGAMMSLNAAKNVIATLGERLISAGERTKAIKVSKSALEFARQDSEKIREILTGDSKYTDKNKLQQNKRVFKSNFLENLRKFNSNALDAEDWIFLKYHYEHSLAQIMTARGITANQLQADTQGTNQLLENLRDIAVRQAQTNTFRDFNAIGNWMSRQQRNLSAGGKGAKAAGFMLEGVMPFKNTPMNIAKQGINYSPVGIIKGAAELFTGVKKGNISAAQAIDHISSGIVGSGLLAVGYLLSRAGILALLPDKDKESELAEAMGVQNYALKLGNTYYSIDWLVPAMMPIAIGANIWKATQNQGYSASQAFVNSLNAVTEPLIELSCLQGISNTLDTIAYQKEAAIISIMEETMLSYIGQAIPTIGGQLARTIDATKRQTFVDKNSKVPTVLQKFIQQQAKKIPFASMALMPQLDIWGNEKKQNPNVIGRAAEQFVSPGYVTFNKNDLTEKELARLNEATGETKMIPTFNVREKKIGGTDYYFNRKQFLYYNKIKGQKQKQLLDIMIKLPKYKNLSDDEKVKAIEKIYDFADEFAKVKLNPDKTYVLKGKALDYMNYSPAGIAYDCISRAAK